MGGGGAGRGHRERSAAIVKHLILSEAVAKRLRSRRICCSRTSETVAPSTPRPSGLLRSG